MTFLQIWVMRPIRYLCAWHNSMARRTDRVESVIAAVLLVLFGLSFPLASWSAQSVYHTSSEHARTQRASGRWVTAVLLYNAPPAPADGVASESWVKARWTAPDGRKRIEQIPATAGTSAGSSQQIWIDRNGHRTPSPPTSAAIVAEAVGAGLLVVTGAAFVLEIARRAVRSRLDRTRFLGWDVEWDRIGPRWTRPGR